MLFPATNVPVGVELLFVYVYSLLLGPFLSLWSR